MSALNFERDGEDWPLRDASRFIETRSIRWHVQELGDGPHALMLHGTAGSTHSWRGLAPLLAQDFRLVSPDLPRHGFTRPLRSADMSLPGLAESVADLVHALGVSPVLAIGHSAGAAILARLIGQGRLSPRLFVSINGAFRPYSGVGGRLLSGAFRMFRMGPLAARLFAINANRDAVGRLISGMGSRLDPQGLDLYLRLMRNPSHCEGALAMMANWDLSHTIDDLAHISCRSILIVGERDKAVHPEEAKMIAKRMSRASVVELPSLGHLAHEENPRDVARCIRRAALEEGLISNAFSMD